MVKLSDRITAHTYGSKIRSEWLSVTVSLIPSRTDEPYLMGSSILITVVEVRHRKNNNVIKFVDIVKHLKYTVIPLLLI